MAAPTLAGQLLFDFSLHLLLFSRRGQPFHGVCKCVMVCLQARRLAALAGSGSLGSSPAYKASRMGPSRELSSSQSPHQGSGANDSFGCGDGLHGR